MGSRTILCGSVRLSKAAFEKAQDTALLELSFMASDDPAEIGVTMKPVTARELFSPGDEAYRLWAVNRYDEANERWVFGVSLHDDDLPNADTDLLAQRLAALKDAPGPDYVVALAEWSGQLELAWRIDAGSGAELDDLPRLPKRAASLIMEGGYAEGLEAAAAALAKAAAH